MNRKLTRPLLSLALAGALVTAAVPPVLAEGGPPAAHSGEVLALENTPHIFVRDAAGVVHLAADPASLAQHQVNWLGSKDVSLADLRQLAPGEPWLSMALVKLGDFVYLPQAPAPGAAP